MDLFEFETGLLQGSQAEAELWVDNRGVFSAELTASPL